MDFKKIFFVCLLLFVLCSINMVCAVDNSEYNLEHTESNQCISQDEQMVLESSIPVNSLQSVDELSNEKLLEGDNSKVIYVGHNNKTQIGEGTEDNPFPTFKYACDSVGVEDSVTIYVSEGVYYLGEGLEPGDGNSKISEMLLFNTNNLNVIGIGNVIIKNYNTDEYDGYLAEAFCLVSNSANFTMSNLIFDSTTSFYPYDDENSPEYYNFFKPFHGKVNLGIFNNCSFISSEAADSHISGGSCNLKFVNCYFEGFYGFLFDDITLNNPDHLFENCIFNMPDSFEFLTGLIYLPYNISMNNIWFGQNSIPSYLGPYTWAVAANPDGVWNYEWFIPVSRYAIFNVAENYLGNNQYEIIGKLTWNGTDNQDGMENFQPMTVTLQSSTGDINQTATLVNGNFKTNYTSSNLAHKINVKLHNEEIELAFTTVNITADPVCIYYDEDQNITVNFTQNITANVTVTVSNGTYNKSEKIEIINKNSTTFTIRNRLKAGTYNVKISLAGSYCGSNITTLTISRVSDYTFDVAAGDVKVGENATIDITLPDDVNGIVIVKFGNATKELPANQTMTVNFTNLNATRYSVNVSYSGNDKYVAKDYPTAFVTVEAAESGLEIEDVVFTYGEVIAIPFNVTNAKGVTVSVTNKDDDEVATASNESGIIKLDTLPAGKYTVYAKTIVDSNNYNWVDATINLTINKANSSLDIQDKEFAYATEAVINAVTKNSTDDVIATLTDENDTEIAVTVSGDSITLPKLNAGKYTLTVTTNPDENHNNVTKSATITIIKTTPLMNVTVEPTENITAKDNPTLTIKLPSDATGEVVVKVNGKKVQDSSANETITINLNNAPGDYIVDVFYSGDKNYESDSKTKEFTISKAETTITANQTTFEEGNASTIEVTIPDINSGIVLVDVEGKKFYGDINKGKANITLEGLSEGNYTANIKFFGDEIYKEATCTASVKVSEPNIITELKEQLEEVQANASQLKDELDNVSGQLVDAQANATQLKEDLDELNQTIADKDAEISNLTDVVAGKDAEIAALNDTVIAQNSTIESQAKEISSLNDTVIAQNSTIENQKEQISNLTHKKDTTLVVDETFTRVAVDYNAGERGGMFYAILKDSEGNVLANKTVQIAINGKIYNKTTDDEGKAGIQVNFANANTYSYAVSFQGDDKYNAAPMASSKLTVTKKKTTIKASNKVFKVKTKTKKISVTLKTVKNQYDNKTYLKYGKKVTLKVNGKTYTAKINKKGVAKFTIKITKKGKYTAKIKFAGDKTYKASSKSIKIRIK